MEQKKVAPGITIMAFADPEELAAYKAKEIARVEAIKLTPEQRGISWGDYAVEVVGDDEIGYLMIYHQIWTEAQFILREGAAGAKEDEIRVGLENLRTIYHFNRRYSTAYSTAAPKGESGASHLAQLWPITKAEFENAKAQGWPMNQELRARIGGQHGHTHST